MAEEPTTHVVYKGKHYVLPGALEPKDALTRIRNLTGDKPKLKPGAPVAEGFEETGAEVADILKRRREPNLPQDIIPKVLEFATLAALPGFGGAAGRGMAAMRGLGTMQKAARVGAATAKAAGYGAAGYGASEALKAVGVPSGVAETAVGVAGLGTKPGRAMVRAGLNALAGEVAATKAAPAAVGAAKAVVAEVAPAAKISAEQLERYVRQASRQFPTVPKNALRQMIEASLKSTGTAVEAAAPAAGKAVAPVVVVEAAPAAAQGLSEETAGLVLKLQQQMGTTAGRKVVREWLSQQPPKVASEIRMLLARGQAHPATVGGGAARAAVTAAERPDVQLARMLGQIP
jgi:hypothetical protein